MTSLANFLEIRTAKIFFWAVLAFAIALAGTTEVGAQNTAYGNGALAHNRSGTGNSAFGESALFSNVGGNDNTAVGAHCLMNNL
jgi:hypothetical protein